MAQVVLHQLAQRLRFGFLARFFGSHRQLDERFQLLDFLLKLLWGLRCRDALQPFLKAFPLAGGHFNKVLLGVGIPFGQFLFLQAAFPFAPELLQFAFASAQRFAHGV
jgi:hypothetical protein